MENRLRFSSDRDGNYDIYAMNPDGEDVQNLTDHPAGDYTPAWFPSALAVSEREKLPTQWAIDQEATGRNAYIACHATYCPPLARWAVKAMRC